MLIRIVEVPLKQLFTSSFITCYFKIMYRYLIELSYMGTRFRGMQRNIIKSGKLSIDTTTVQGCLELALRVFRPVNEINTILSSRTDSGVHALHTAIHVDLQRCDNTPYDVQAITGVLNRTLNKQSLPIRILNTRIVPETFHCRYNALGRTYLYRIAVAKSNLVTPNGSRNKNFEVYLPVEELDRCFFIQDPNFDVQRFIEASRLLVGRHDFRTFMSTVRDKNARASHPMFTVRDIDEINIKPGKTVAVGSNAELAESLYNYWDIEIKAKSFLYKQVRRMVGCLVAVATNRINEKSLYEMVTIPSKNNWDHRVLLSPAFGLYLSRVHYNRRSLKPTHTIITTNTGERFRKTSRSEELVKLSGLSFGFVVDTKPDLIPNCILENFLYLGSQDSVNKETLLNHNITNVLSIGIEVSSLDLIKNIAKLFVPCLDLPETLLVDAVFSKSFDFIEECRLNGGKILIHCNAGISRSPSVVIAYLMHYRGMDFQTAYKYVKTKRPCIQPNEGFLIQLKNYNKIPVNGNDL
ncbi:hypothetical protein GQX74_003221 [Glossina fuscipes]|nr:hypothetical protein GQX74_003221 [Glossina fuscipes]